MKKLEITLENCYWIKKLDYRFDFEKSNVYSIYAPNWTMKTSFTKSFIDVVKWDTPKDLINALEWVFIFNDETWNQINIESILPIKSMDLKFEPKEISSLLVNKDDKEEYDKMFIWITKGKDNLIKKICTKSKVPKIEIESKILNDFDKKWVNFFNFLEELLDDLELSEDLSDVEYNIIFWDSKILEILENPEMVKNIEKYDKKYNEILDNPKYKYFKKWVFTPYKANILIKAIKDQKFFQVEDNGIILAKRSVENIVELETEINSSLKEIEKDSELKKIKEKISVWTKPIQTFQDLIENKWEKIIPQLKNLNSFKKELWKSYFFEIKKDILELVYLYNSWLSEMKRIQEKAKLEKTEWKKIVKKFEDRFYIPFKVDIEDATNTILWTKEPEIIFKYDYNKLTGKYDKKYNKWNLLWLDILSWWEQRALYILYILFEIETRKLKWWDHLLIIDDIADSFDYKNKYAIIEYLQEISEDKNFKMIILTHNFDFYRSIQMRLNIKKWETLDKSANLSVVSDNWNIKIINWTDYLDPINYFIGNYHLCNYKLIALIPVARNLVEYIFWKKDIPNEDWSYSNYYLDLTSILHIKSKKINEEDLYEIYNLIFNKEFNKKSNKWVISIIYDLCDDIESEWITEKLDLDKKIVLSIWIRLKAEEFMFTKKWTTEQDWFQTRKLYDFCKKKLLSNDEEKIIKKILLMTPEAIHLNSFMYEPILDISDEHLIDLYIEVRDNLK